MAQELVYTSVEKGLKSGSKGFCTVASSEEIPPKVFRILEMLNTYRHLGVPNSPDNPTNCAHFIYSVGQTTGHLFSKMTDAGLDYSGRGNFLIQHILPSQEEIESLCQSNPADLFTDSKVFMRNWEGKPRKLPERKLTLPTAAIHPCNLWKTFTGDAGWAGILAEAAESRRSVCLLGEKDLPFLALFQEALSLLPPVLRWNTTFASFYTSCPPGVSCLWKGIVKGEPEEALFAADQKTLRLDLTKKLPSLPQEKQFEKYVRAAQTGKVPPGFFEPLVSRTVPAASQTPKNIFMAGRAPQISIFESQRSGQMPDNEAKNVFEKASKKTSSMSKEVPFGAATGKNDKDDSKTGFFTDTAKEDEFLLKRSLSFHDFADEIFSEKPAVFSGGNSFNPEDISKKTSPKENAGKTSPTANFKRSLSKTNFESEKSETSGAAFSKKYFSEEKKEPDHFVREAFPSEKIRENAEHSFREFQEREEDVSERSFSTGLLVLFIFLTLTCTALAVIIFFVLRGKS